jgi:hypothetical protein
MQTARTNNMKRTKHALWKIGAGALALAIMPLAVRAVPISGSISFNGNVTPFVSTTGTGSVASDYSTAHSLVFGQTFVSAGADGSFASVPVNSTVLLFSPLAINPPGLPVPPTAPLWTTSIGGFTFTLTTLTEDVLVSPFNTLTLRGTGVLADGNPADKNTGTWVATFTTASSTSGGATFSWNSSSQSDVASVPDNYASCMLLGLGLISLRAFGYFKKDQAKKA